eukprot:8227535-Alexandrium_andersonii.AAC.1
MEGGVLSVVSCLVVCVPSAGDIVCCVGWGTVAFVDDGGWCWLVRAKGLLVFVEGSHVVSACCLCGVVGNGL